MFSYEICQILKNTYFEEHLRKSASICNKMQPFNLYVGFKKFL